MEELKPIRQNEVSLDFNSSDTTKLVEELKNGRRTDLPDVDELNNHYDVSRHDVFDRTKRPDKPKKKIIKKEVEVEQPSLTGGVEKVKIEKDVVVDDGVTKVNRIGLAQEKKIVNQAVAFTVGNPVELTCNHTSDQEKEVFDRVVEILEDNKIDSFNRKLCRSIFGFKEGAECWYHVKGSDGKWKLRVQLFSPVNGDVLYPYFDDFGDMIAFSREYSVKRGKEEVKQFTTYTSEKIYYFEQNKGKWEQVGIDPVAVGKITIIYGHQDQAEFEDVTPLIARREKLRSNFGDTNDYHASPKIVAKGAVKGFVEKEEAGGIINLEGEDASVNLLTWDQAPESIKLEDELLNNDIHSLTDTADLSFNNLLRLGTGVSGETLRRLLTAPMLKVYEKKEYLDEYMQRRVNLLKAYVGVIDPSLKEASKTVRIKASIKPLQLDDLDDYIDRLKKENGGKPIKSQAQTIREYISYKGGNAEDVDLILEELKEESSTQLIEDTYHIE